MKKTVLLRKATRIEGNAEIRLEIEGGRVQAARFAVHDFRGVEKFVEGRRVEELPMLVSRICGLCSGAHQVASLRAVEDALGAAVPPGVEAVRDALVLGEWISSHALSYFFLTMPDLMEGSEGILELAKRRPDIGDDALGLRKAGRRIVELLGGRAVHPVTLAIAGFCAPPSAETIAEAAACARDAEQRAARLAFLVTTLPLRREPVPFPQGQPVHLLAAEGGDGARRLVARSRDGEVTADFPATEFKEHVGELRAEWTFAKFPYLRKFGFPGGIVLVGPLARLHRPGGPLADEAVAALPLAAPLRDPAGVALEDHDTCRLLEIVWAARRIRSLLAGVDPGSLRGEAVPDASGPGIGVVEAPRGLLVHSYLVRRGLLERMRLLVATQFNNPLINLLLREQAGAHLEDGGLSAEGERRVGRCIRLFDPCLSCATH